MRSDNDRFVKGATYDVYYILSYGASILQHVKGKATKQ
jgi:hypothetical protein